MRGLLLSQWLPIALAVGAEGVVIPYAAGLGRPGAAGIVFAAMAGGMFTGNFVVGRSASPARRDRLTSPLALVPPGTVMGLFGAASVVSALLLDPAPPAVGRARGRALVDATPVNPACAPTGTSDTRTAAPARSVIAVPPDPAPVRHTHTGPAPWLR